MASLTPEQIEKELSAIEQGERCPWWIQSVLLDTIESTRYWQRDAHSFTDWVEQNACRFGVKPPMLWRRLTAGRYIHQIKERLERKGIELPDLSELPANVGPESVELLAKIERVFPQDKFLDLVCRFFAGKVARSELKSLWTTYKPVLGGKTAQGRGVRPPRINTQDPEQQNVLMEAMALEILKSAGPDWSGHSHPKLYQIFLHVTPDESGVSIQHSMFSAVSVIKTINGSIEYHGFRYPWFLPEGKEPMACPEAAYCDFLWFMVPPGPQRKIHKTRILDALPTFVGLVAFTNGNVDIIRRAQPSPRVKSLRDKLIQALFFRSMESK